MFTYSYALRYTLRRNAAFLTLSVKFETGVRQILLSKALS
jgi:hypothetical protein